MASSTSGPASPLEPEVKKARDRGACLPEGDAAAASSSSALVPRSMHAVMAMAVVDPSTVVPRRAAVPDALVSTGPMEHAIHTPRGPSTPSSASEESMDVHDLQMRSELESANIAGANAGVAEARAQAMAAAARGRQIQLEMEINAAKSTKGSNASRRSRGSARGRMAPAPEPLPSEFDRCLGQVLDENAGLTLVAASAAGPRGPALGMMPPRQKETHFAPQPSGRPALRVGPYAAAGAEASAPVEPNQLVLSSGQTFVPTIAVGEPMLLTTEGEVLRGIALLEAEADRRHRQRTHAAVLQTEMVANQLWDEAQLAATQQATQYLWTSNKWPMMAFAP